MGEDKGEQKNLSQNMGLHVVDKRMNCSVTDGILKKIERISRSNNSLLEPPVTQRWQCC